MPGNYDRSLLQRLDESVFGNGREGLDVRVSTLETKVERIEASAGHISANYIGPVITGVIVGAILLLGQWMLQQS